MPKRKAHVQARSRNLAKWRKKEEEHPSQPPSHLPVPSPSPPPSAAPKRKSLLSDEVKEKVIVKNRIILEKEDLETLVEKTACGECFSTNTEVKFTHHMLDTYFSVKCECGAVMIDTNESRKPEMEMGEKFYPITALFIYCMMVLGAGYDGASRVTSFLSLQHFTIRTYIRYAKHITEKAIQHTQNILKKSRKAVLEHYSAKEGGVAENGYVNVDVTYDGTWHKRGFKSNYGVGAAIDVDCGMVLDYDICSKLCDMCISKERELKEGKITDAEYVWWWEEEHWQVCDSNYESASGGMESDVAVTLWSRSCNNGMMYRTFVSDGDSSAYKSVCALNNNHGPYGEGYAVDKAECINHVAKRLGTGLRDKKKKVGGMSGKNKITDIVIEHLQFYFQLSLKRKLHTSTKEMREEILSTFYHCTSTDANPQHHFCQKGETSWCFYQKAVAQKKVPQSHKKMLVYFHLEPKELSHVKALYDRLTTDEIMKKCMKGMTQNKNEHLHSKICKITPKHRNASPRMIKFAAATAVAIYNAGYEGGFFSSLLNTEFTSSMQVYLQGKDKDMDTPIRRKMKRKFVHKSLLDYAAGLF